VGGIDTSRDGNCSPANRDESRPTDAWCAVGAGVVNGNLPTVVGGGVGAAVGMAEVVPPMVEG
jgi:hypothetical protein